jgi:hypothetical protein
MESPPSRGRGRAEDESCLTSVWPTIHHVTRSSICECNRDFIGKNSYVFANSSYVDSLYLYTPGFPLEDVRRSLRVC